MRAHVPLSHPTPRRFPLFSSAVPAGFPSPADDYIETQLDLNEYLVGHKEATFFVRVKGDSMCNAGIDDGDLLVVDRSLEPVHCDIVVAVVDAELTVKTLFKRGETIKLVPANDAYPEITIRPENGLTIWGVVTGVIRSFRRAAARSD